MTTIRKPDLRWLIVGAALGIAAAGYGMLRQTSVPEPLPANALARINDTLISRSLFERTRDRLAAPTDDPAADERLLERLIDDELLVQRGVELGMTESDATVRNAIVSSLVASITAEADAASPDDAALERHLAKHPERFSYTARLHVAAWLTDDEPLAQAFLAALREGDTAAPPDGISRMPDLPDGLTDTRVLRDYLGPAITAAAAEMPDGSSAVFARRGRWLILSVVARDDAVETDLAAIRNRVLLDYRRSLADRMLEEYLEDLRERADIERALP